MEARKKSATSANPKGLAGDPTILTCGTYSSSFLRRAKDFRRVFTSNQVRKLGRKAFRTPWSARLISYIPSRFVNPFPTVLYVGITNDCNLDCVMCRRQHTVIDPGYMSMDLYRAIVDEAATTKAAALFPVGLGEPLLHPEFLPMLEYARGKTIAAINVISNATVLTEEIARGMIEIRVDELHCSVDAIHPRTYARQRRGGKLEEVMENIERFLEIRARHGTDRPALSMRFLRTSINAADQEAFVNYWSSRLSDRDEIRIDQVAPYNKANIERRKRKPYPPCSDLWKMLGIRWDGAYVLCGGLPDNTLGVNARFPDTSIRAVWNCPEFNEVRRKHLRGRKTEVPACKQCITPFFIE